MIRIIIAGGRTFNDYYLLTKSFKELLSELREDNTFEKKDVEIISGTANGADKLGEVLAKRVGLKTVRFPANWDKFGKSAGYIRNKEMAVYAKEDGSIGVLLSFWDGESKGTKHMIDLANSNGLKVKTVIYG